MNDCPCCKRPFFSMENGTVYVCLNPACEWYGWEVPLYCEDADEDWDFDPIGAWIDPD